MMRVSPIRPERARSTGIRRPLERREENNLGTTKKRTASSEAPRCGSWSDEHVDEDNHNTERRRRSNEDTRRCANTVVVRKKRRTA